MNLFYETNKPSQPELDYYSEAVFFKFKFSIRFTSKLYVLSRGTYETHIVDVFKLKKIMTQKQQKDLIEKFHAY